jgi:trigger factor
MNVTVEDLTSVKKRLHIEVPQATVAREVDAAYGELKKNAKVKGFRPGKTPRSVLERLFRKDVQADVTGKLLQEALMEAIRGNDLKVVGAPQVSPPPLDASQPYRFEATVEIAPQIGSIDFRGLQLKKSRYQASDAEIDVQLRLLQKNMARLTPISEPRPVAQGDIVLIDHQGFIDGVPFAEAPKTENVAYTVGQAKISAEFDQGLIGMQAGATREIAVTFAADHATAALAGRSVTFKVYLHEIRQEELPPIDDELAKRLGNCNTLEELKTKIRDHLTHGYEKRSEQELNEQIFASLIARSSFEVPDAMIQFELEGILADTERTFAHHNLSMDQLGMTREGLAAKYRDTAEKQVRRHLILSRIAEQEKLTVPAEELERFYAEMAAGVQQPVEMVREYYTLHEDKREALEHTLLEKQAIRLIIESSQIEEIAAQSASPTSPEPPAPGGGAGA